LPGASGYSGGSQLDFARLYLEKTFHKKELMEWLQGVGLNFKPQYHKKQQQKKQDMKLFDQKHCVNELGASGSHLFS
jgi:hypothetical protein